MKKIIELAEKMLTLEVMTILTNYSDTAQKLKDTTIQLNNAIKERKALENTPITEDWLKKHGWEVHEVLRGFIPAPYVNRHIGKDYLEYDMRRASLRVFLEYVEGDGTYSDFYCENIDSVAKLLDACELCGINLEV